MTQGDSQNMTVLERIKRGPVSFAALAGSRSPSVRARLRPVIDWLVEVGEIRLIRLDGFAYYVAAAWVLTDEMRLQLIEGRCKPVDGCMVWTGYVDPKRGPMVRFGPDDKPTSTRRMVWQIKRGPLGYQQTIRCRADCHEACVEYTHMVRGRREDLAKGRSITVLQRARIARAHQQRGKLDWDKVHAIRASREPAAVLSERYGVSKPTITQVRRGETWREMGGLFTGLMPGRAAAC
ncbi:hypothetical protein C8245_21300 [Paracidovorax avenae]|nr:hypothetical protein C8245_21300 [Paracidovorax avenae]